MNPQTLDRLDALHARLYRWRWWVRVAVAAVLLPWAYRVALPRINAMPAQPPAPPNAGQPAIAPSTQPDLSQKLADIMQALPDPPVVPVPTRAPIGKQWVRTPRPLTGCRISILHADDLRDPFPSDYPLSSNNVYVGAEGILAGEWLPQTRYALRESVAHLRSPAVQEAIARIHRAVSSAAGPWQMQRPDVLLTVQVLLAAQGRYHIAAEHDVTAATGELRTILKLAAHCEAAASFAGLNEAQNLRGGALAEMMYWDREFALSREQANQLAAVLDDCHLDLRGRWKEAVRGERVRLEEGLDKSYTRDGQGNGWYVIHSPDPSAPLDKAYCLLNVASLWMTDRAGMVRKIRAYTEATAAKIDLPYDLAVQQIASIQDCDVNSSPVDGPYVQWSGAVNMWATLSRCIGTLRAEAGARTCLALSVYRHDHGVYPAQLADLVPAYLPILPTDPLRNQPLKYEPDAKEGYRLYVVGRGTGRPVTRRGSILEYDEVLSTRRSDAGEDFYLRSLADWVVIEGEGATP